MTTQQKIEIMQAYERGEDIQEADLGEDNWEDVGIREPSWNWVMYSYRIKPKESKFKKGDSVVFKQRETDTLSLSDIFYYDDPALDSNNPFIYEKVNDLLWYWEFKMSDGWHISKTRMTKNDAQVFVGEDVTISPLYALGFRVKDSK